MHFNINSLFSKMNEIDKILQLKQYDIVLSMKQNLIVLFVIHFIKIVITILFEGIDI